MKVERLKDQLCALQAKKEQNNANLVQTQISSAQLNPIVKAKQAKYDRLESDYEQIAPKEDLDKAELLENDIVIKLSNVYSRVGEVGSSMKSKRERHMKAGSEVEHKDTQIRQLRRDLNILQNEQREVEVARAKAETKLETTLEHLNSTYEMAFECARSQKAEIDVAEARKQVVILRREISSLGNTSLDAPQKYKEVNKRFELLSRQRDDLVAAKNKVLEAIDEMDDIMVEQFQEVFGKINTQLNDVFRMLFGGGKACSLMVDPEDVLNTGIDIDVQPPRGTVQNVRLFNGGEEGLIAVRVLLSILKTRTMPLCVSDEIEAALDQANVEHFTKYITQFRGKSQSIIVTHRPGTMAQCDALYGVTMQQSGVSQLLRVRLQDAINVIGKEEAKA